ncbi:MAG: OstA family protein [Verrucomicrobia bacterium]|nr:OstA family protein [Verrucomicrobiota bacterium]
MKTAAAFLLLALAVVSPGRAELPPETTSLSCDDFDMHSVGDETSGVCKGAVVVTGTNLKIICDRLEFTATGVGDKSSTVPTLRKFKYMIATGHVVIVQGDREATCGRAEVLPQENKIVLTESPVLVDKSTGWTSQGEKITMLRGERRVIVDKSRVTGPALRDLGVDAGKPASPAADPAKPVPPK